FSSLNVSDKSLILQMERVKGIEPSSSAWKAVALPLSYTRARKALHASPPSPRLRRLAFAIGRLASRSAAGAKAGGGGSRATRPVQQQLSGRGGRFGAFEAQKVSFATPAPPRGGR